MRPQLNWYARAMLCNIANHRNDASCKQTRCTLTFGCIVGICFYSSHRPTSCFCGACILRIYDCLHPQIVVETPQSICIFVCSSVCAINASEHHPSCPHTCLIGIACSVHMIWISTRIRRWMPTAKTFRCISLISCALHYLHRRTAGTTLINRIVLPMQQLFAFAD